MTSNVAVMMAIIGLIITHSEAASISKTNDSLPAGGPKTLMLNITRLDEPLTLTPMNMTTTELDFQGSGKREKRNIFLAIATIVRILPLLKTMIEERPKIQPPTSTKTEEPHQELFKRVRRSASHTTIGGDGGRASVMFLQSSRSHSIEEDKHFSTKTITDETIDKYNLNLRTSFTNLLRSKLNLRSTFKSTGAVEPIGFDKDGQHSSTSDALIDKYDSSPKTLVNDIPPLKLN